MSPSSRLDELWKQLNGLIYIAFQRGRDSMAGTAGDKMKHLEQAGAGIIICVEDSKKLHEAYVQLTKECQHAGKDAMPLLPEANHMGRDRR